ncbi:MAG: MarR family transcriptional regulator [bacterium]
MTTESLPDCLYYLVTRASLVATTLLKKGLATANVEHVKPGYLGLLMALWQQDGLQAAEAARLAGLEPSTTTGLLDRLERLGMVERRTDPGDRRAVRIHLTQEGRRLEPAVRAVVDAALARAAEGIAPKDLETTRCVLRKFLLNAAAATRS